MSWKTKGQVRQSTPTTAKAAADRTTVPSSRPDAQTLSHSAHGVAFDFSRIPLLPGARVSQQPMLTVSAPGDAYEREADRVSEQVMGMPEPRHQRACACGGGCFGCKTEGPGEGHQRLQTKRVGSGHPGYAEAPPSVHEVLRSPGQPLDPATRAFMEPRFGHDFSKVRVHADAKGSASARAVNALAYTVGKDVVLGAGRYAPGTREGGLLLAHELTHVLQQDAAATQLVQRQDAPGGGQPAPVTEPSTSPDVTPGEFGKALGFRLKQEFEEAVAAEILARLQASDTFMSMAADLDDRVVSLTGGNLGKALHPGEGEKPRDVVDFIFTTDGSYFEPAQTGDNRSDISKVVIGLPDPRQGPFGGFEATHLDTIAARIVHETEHLQRYLDGRPAAATAAEAVSLGVQEEAEVRGVEQAAAREMASAHAAGSRKTRDIQRDLTGIGGYKTTYLEAFALGFLREAAAKALSVDQRKAADALYNEFARDLLPLIPLAGVSDWDFYSMAVSTLMVTHQDAELKQLAVNDQAIEYVTARVVLRFLDSRWRQFEKSAAEGRAADKEPFLQENLKAFGAKAGVRYSP